MKIRKLALVFIFCIIVISLCCCPREDNIILHGDIKGLVTDAETTEPIQDASIKLSPSKYTAITGNDGTYLFENITPGPYEIQASKSGYGTKKETIKVVEAKTKIMNFILLRHPVPNVSVPSLNFEFDLTSLSFTISNASTGEFEYNIMTSQDWITVSPSSGDISEETDSITVTIDKTSLSENTYEDTIKINTYFETVLLQEIILNVYVNSLVDINSNIYPVVKIGNQLWMAKNLNTGIKISEHTRQTNNGTIEKYCYAGSDYNCDTYGGLYQWYEVMQYNISDTGTIGTTQGICPDGWHIPTENEWNNLINFVLGSSGKLMEKGILHWQGPNSFATNESGFTALPAGMISGTPGEESLMLGLWANWWSSGMNTIFVCSSVTRLENNNEFITGSCYNIFCGVSVRCLKNP